MSAGAVRAPLIIPLRVPPNGVPKSHIDSTTRLEILSETPNVDIYFTINGSRPVVAKHDKELINTGTYKFKHPFTLPPGIQTVRAVAFSPDTGGESNVVTKTFEVVKSKKASNRINDYQDDYGFLEDLKIIESHRRRRSNGFTKPTTHEFLRQLITSDREKSKRAGILKNQWDKRLRSPPVSTSKAVQASSTVTCVVPRVELTTEDNQEKLKSSPQRKENDPGHHSAQDELLVQSLDQMPRRSIASYVPDPAVPLTRLQHVTDVVHCPHCFHVRSANPTHQFCTNCGQTLPKLPYPIRPEPVLDKLGVCRTCGSNVPLNLATCLVCERSLLASPKEHPMKTREYRLCTTCGTPNPSNLTSCLMCEARLSTDTTHLIYPRLMGPSGLGSISSAPRPLSIATQSNKPTRTTPYLPCVHCSRENNPDARYCDWCGLETQILPARGAFERSEQPLRLYQSNELDLRQLVLECNRCGTAVSRDSKFCCGCGSPVEPPARHAIWANQVKTRGDMEESLSSENHGERSPAKRANPVVVSNAATQTVGLFYPSSADLRRQSSLTRTPSSIDMQMRDRMPLLTAVSPGRGYWRKQLDHIIAHLKVYTNNNPEFRTVIGEPRLGKLLTADLSETRGHATVLLTFTLPDSIYSGSTGSRSEDRIAPRDRPVREPKGTSVTAPLADSELYTAMSFQPIKDHQHSVQSMGKLTPHNREDPPDGRKIGESVSVDEASEQSPHSSEIRHRQDEEFSNFSNGSQSGDNLSNESKKGTPRTRRLKTSARSQRTTNSVRSSRSGRKSDTRHGKKSASTGHHGEAGVAIQRESKLTSSDRNLIHLLKKSTEPTGEEIRRLIDEGANPNCVTADGETPLVLAVHQRHEQAIAPLIEAGAKPNVPGMLNGNTALHEAVLCGFDGVQMVDLLLKHGASPKIKNKRQETPHAIAMRMKCEPLTQLFLAHMGQMQLEQLNKHVTTPDRTAVQFEKETDDL